METTYVNSSPFILAGVFMFFIFMLHVITSAWLFGQKLFLTTIISGCLSIILIFGLGSGDITFIFASIYGSLFIVYAFGMKYVMNSKFFDIENQSHQKLKEFISSKEEVSLFDGFLLKLGPILVYSIWLYAFYYIAIRLIP
ncbi:MAG: hypothetical protein HND53_08990 [Proteobacteria bacterium]|nr:hypothetical protein [Pseudomonadota bacterium]NOG60620.1 hypothetical protein [Pseudomonadota bacterium]